MSTTPLGTFASLNQDARAVLAFLTKDLLPLAALYIADTKAGIDRLTSKQIVDCLESAGALIDKDSAVRALNRPGDKVSAKKDGGDAYTYKLMTPGHQEMELLLGKLVGPISVVRIESGQPRTTGKQLAEALADLRGTVKICDPYYGEKTLDSLDYMPAACKVRFLTVTTNESSAKIERAIRDFTKQRPNTVFRIAAKPSDLHDRSVLTNDSLLILGHGLKDIGSKEPSSLVSGATTHLIFWTRWPRVSTTDGESHLLFDRRLRWHDAFRGSRTCRSERSGSIGSAGVVREPGRRLGGTSIAYWTLRRSAQCTRTEHYRLLAVFLAGACLRLLRAEVLLVAFLAGTRLGLLRA